MRRILITLHLAVTGVLCAGAALWVPSAPASAQAGDKKGKTIELKSTAEKHQSAATVEFAKELALAFHSLTTLGPRIEDARGHKDPVGLAAAATELAAAEKASGKFASIKSEQLMKEAIDLAKIRWNSAELKAVADLAGPPSNKELLTQAVKAAEMEEKCKTDKAQGLSTRGIHGTCHVDSRVNTDINVYINGVFAGSMGPMGDIYPTIFDSPGGEATLLEARGNDGRSWRKRVTGNYSSYHWILLD